LKPALRGLSFEVAPGETMLVLGPSGSGKSTLTLCLDGLIPHLVEGDYEGQVSVAGLVVADSSVRTLAQEVGLVFQDPEAQFCTLTVEDEIAFGPENLGRSMQEIEAAIDRSLSQVGLPGFRSRRLAELSGGEKQRVALAAVLAMEPQVLVLDEPSANLDPRGTAELFGLLRELAKERRHTIVVIEHKLDELIDWIDSVLVLDHQGSLLFRGPAADAFYDRGMDLAEAGVWLPQTVELVRALRDRGWDVAGRPLGIEDTALALAAVPGLRSRLAGRRRLEASAGIAGRTTRGAVGRVGPPVYESSRPALYRIEGLTYRYAGSTATTPALERVSFTIERGSFTAIAGINGAGKSTLGSLLSGILEPPPGMVYLEGRDVAIAPARWLSDRVGYVFQNPEHQFVGDTVLGELVFSLTGKRGRKGRVRLSPEQGQLAESWLEKLGLLPLAEANPFAISQGQKRRLSVAAMLIRGQSCLFLDEPTLGQDESNVERLMEMMQGFREDGGTVVMITHDMRLVCEHADSLVVLAGGRAIIGGPPPPFFSRPELVASAGLEIPVPGRVGNALERAGGPKNRLFTIGAYLGAAGRGTQR
jgi:energy-coupling factor transporter ATP-binding protein EcfA2